MSRRLVVRPWGIEDSASKYDAVIAAVGYETRASYVSKTLVAATAHKLACGFAEDHLFSYDDNYSWFTTASYEVKEVADAEFLAWIQNSLGPLEKKPKSSCKIRIDISSLSRFRLATLVHYIRSLDWKCEIVVDFVYSMAEYSPPPSRSTANRHAGPVISEFSGWWLEPELPPVAIVGLGYEENKALGAVEHIQAADVWLFIPKSPLAKYSSTLSTSNKQLLDLIPDSHKLSYRVDQPFSCFTSLESLVSAAGRKSNPMIFPFGPKIFAICSLLVGCLHPQIAIWRFSGSEDKVDRKPSKFIYGLQGIFLNSSTA
jgi:hypothetical protein